jgi:hypothetical protein
MSPTIKKMLEAVMVDAQRRETVERIDRVVPKMMRALRAEFPDANPKVADMLRLFLCDCAFKWDEPK